MAHEICGYIMNMQRKIKQLLEKLDVHTLEVVSGALTTLMVRSGGALAAFLLNVAIARILGAELAGVYFLCLSVVIMSAVIVKVGLDNSILRFVAEGYSSKDWVAVKGVVNLSLKWVSIASMFIIIPGVLFSSWLATEVFNKPNMVLPLQVILPAVMTFSIMTLIGEALKGAKKIRDSVMVSGLLYPLFALAMVSPMSRYYGVLGICAMYVMSTGASAMVGMHLWKKTIPDYRNVECKFDKGRLWKSCKPLWLMTIVNRALLPWAPVFMLGVWASASDSGIFAAATRISTLISMLLAAVNTVLAPKFTELYAGKEMKTLEVLSKKFALAVFLASSPIYLTMIFAGDWVMGLFGPSFATGGSTLAVLAIGQAVTAFGGPAGYLLMMTGNERALLYSSLMSVIVMILLAIVLISGYGSMGAAIASSMASICANVLILLMVRKKLNMSLLPLFPCSIK